MKQKAQKVDNSSIKEMNSIIIEILRDKTLTEEAISLQAGYNEGYISQCRSRGSAPKKFINSIKRAFPDGKKITMGAELATMVQDVQQLKAVVTVLMSHVANVELKCLDDPDAWVKMGEEAKTILRGLPSLG